MNDDTLSQISGSWARHIARKEREKQMNLPDMELIADAVHNSWMQGKLAKGITSRKAEDGEELMVPYSALSEAQKEQDRGLVRTVYQAIEALELKTIGAKQ